MTQLDLASYAPPSAESPSEPVDKYAAEWAEVRRERPHLFQKFVELCQLRLRSGCKSLSPRSVWESLRELPFADERRTVKFKINNNWTKACADDARREFPELAKVLRTRGAK